METIGGLDYIFVDHFAPFRVQVNRNRFEWGHAFFVAAVPVCGGVLLAVFANKFITGNIGPIVAIYAVMASVMTAIMPTIQGLIGPVDRDRIKALKDGSITSDKNINDVRAIIARVEIVRGLYAAVGWSVIVLCVSLIPLLFLGHSSFQYDSKPPVVDPGIAIRLLRDVFVAIVAFSGTTAFIAMLQIVSDVHLMIRHNQVDVESDLSHLKDRYHL